MSELTGQKIDESFGMFPPFYTDCGRNIHIPEGFAYSLDGEIIYESKFTIEIVPGALNFAAPDKE